MTVAAGFDLLLIYFKFCAVIAFAGTAGGFASVARAQGLALGNLLLALGRGLGPGRLGTGAGRMRGSGTIAIGTAKGVDGEGLELCDAFELDNVEIVEGSFG